MCKLLVKQCQLLLLLLKLMLIIELMMLLRNHVFVVVVLFLIQKNALRCHWEDVAVIWINPSNALLLCQRPGLMWPVHRLLRLAGVLHLNQELLGLILSMIIIICSSSRILTRHLALSSILAIELTPLGKIVGVCAAK